MKSIEFEDVNVRFAENQEEYQTLPALRVGDDCDTIITCWGLSFMERLRLLFTGRIWMSEKNFHNDLTPRFFSTKRKEVYIKPGEKEYEKIKNND